MIVLDEKTLCDLECILGGYFSPLTTFMGENDWWNVCQNLSLENETFFPLPVTLAVDPESCNIGDEITLVDSTLYPIAKMVVEEMYEPDINWECLQAYGSNDDNHPYVAYKMTHIGKVYVSGPLTKINDVRHYDYKDLRMTPSEVNSLLSEYTQEGVSVVGFQTRNPMHRAHYELTKYALSKTEDENAVLFLNPVVGETQSVDINYQIRVNCYKEILQHYDNKVVLSLLPLAMRMAGPREACLHAVIRKNYGCTHFVVGRDHAGPSFKTKTGDSFYGPYDAQHMLFKYARKIGIEPIVSKMIVYNESKGVYQPIDEVPEGDNVLQLSGTEVRRRLKSGEEIPEWFSYPNVVSILQKSAQKGNGVCYYFVGLSGSGKTTFANMLYALIKSIEPSRPVTILDGDVVRQNLSKGLGFTKEDRSTNVRRIGYVASEIVRHGGTVICANIAPYDEDRLNNRKLIEQYGKYCEIFVDTPLEVCEKRDVKGLYKLAREGKIKQFTGISDPFEEPTKADVVIREEDYDVAKLL